VLLTIASIFLCGIVVTYVATAEDFKKKYDTQRNDRNALEEKVESLTTQLNDKVAEKDELEKTLNAKMAEIKTKADEYATKLTTAEREKAELTERTNNLAGITKDFSATIDKQTQTLNSALEEVKQLKAEQLKQGKELDETSAALMEKTAIIASLETEKRRLTEEKSDLQTKMDSLLRAGGKAPGATPVAQESRPVSSALKGLINQVDVKNSLATITIGSADGVKEEMKFHVTRGDEFVCDIRIIDVDTDKSVGVLELIQMQPKAGDSVSTSL